jgi:hypothetical protein
LREPSEYVIWGATSLLALLLGLGSAFVLWAALFRSSHADLARGAVGSLGLGVVLIGAAAMRPMMRMFFVLFGAALMLGYIAGGPEFARLVPDVPRFFGR